MNKVFQDLKSINGFIGGYVFKPKIGILAKEMPAVYKDKKLSELGDVLIKTYKSGSLHFPNIIDVSICFQEAVIIIREAANNIFIFVLVDPASNLNLFNMTLSVLMEEIADLVEVPEQNGKPATVESEPTPPQPMDSVKPLTADELLKEGPLSSALLSIQDTLAMVMGPIARIIMADALNEWLKINTPSKGSIPALVDILCKEINDSQRVEDFKKRISALISLTNN